MAHLRTIRRFATAAAAAASLALAATPALAWGPDGHREVGSLGDRMIKKHPNAAKQVRAIMGDIKLADAGPWADCIRSVSGPDGGFKYTHSPIYGAPCVKFETAELTAQMEDYVKRNWSNCAYKGKDGCHTQYHFVDLALQRSAYRLGEVGTYDYDVVHGIDAAIATLRGEPTPAPFNFTKRDALMMLVHFLGDIHQPLHVGSIYLDPDGHEVDPDSSQAERDRAEKVTSTFGGNSLTWMEKDKQKNLHSTWDGVTPGDYSVADARKVAATQGPDTAWAADWATDSLVQAQQHSFPGLSFGARAGRSWPISFTNKVRYQAERKKIQRLQIEKAGARLTQLLLDIWPD
jgi:hypothetical protein